MRGNLLPAASTVLDRNELFFDKGAQSAGICGEVDVKLCAGRFALQIENTGTVMVKNIPVLTSDTLNFEEVMSNYKKVLTEIARWP